MEERRELRTNPFVRPQQPVFIIPGFQNDSSLTIKLTFDWKAATLHRPLECTPDL